MQKIFGLLLMALVLLSGGKPAFAQSTPPSSLDPRIPVSSPFLHFIATMLTHWTRLTAKCSISWPRLSHPRLNQPILEAIFNTRLQLL